MAAAREVGARVALALAGIALSLVLFEIGLRALEGASESRNLRSLHELRLDREWLFGLRPGAEGRIAMAGDILYRINADGFRGRRHARPKPEGVFRVVVVGDSVAFGYGVEEDETFSAVLEAGLGELAPGARFEIVNLGVGGYNAYTEAKLLEDLGVGWEPDLVVVQWCINDMNDPALHFNSSTRVHLGAIPDAAYPNPARRRAVPSPPPPWLASCRRLRLCARLDDFRLSREKRSLPVGAMGAAGRAVDGSPGPEWRWLEGLYVEMAATASAGGAQFAVLAFPYPKQLRETGAHPVQRRLVEMGARRGWPVVNPLPAFRAAARETDERLFVDWWHPSARGHRLAADVMLETFACAGLLPGAQALCGVSERSATRRP